MAFAKHFESHTNDFYNILYNYFFPYVSIVLEYY